MPLAFAGVSTLQQRDQRDGRLAASNTAVMYNVPQQIDGGCTHVPLLPKYKWRTIGCDETTTACAHV